MSHLIIIEPWFTAIGHPAQSLLNTARVVGPRQDVSYLISTTKGDQRFCAFATEIAQYGRVHRFPALAPAHSTNTLLAFLWAVRFARRFPDKIDVFFLDSHMISLAVAHRMLGWAATNIRSLSVLQLFGPEAVLNPSWRQGIVAAWLRGSDARMFLRTQELCEAWRQAVADKACRIDTLPSLEIPDDNKHRVSAPSSGPTRFGVLGQVRPGKGLEWLVPLFCENPELGELKVFGGFPSIGSQVLRVIVEQLPGFQSRYLTEEELFTAAISLDYILTLYQDWDPRLEAATFYLAARARRPVVCYDKGWCGRMVREFGCGIAIDSNGTPSREMFSSLPDRSSKAYEELAAGMDAFRLAHSGEGRKKEFLGKLTGECVAPPQKS